MTILCSQIFVMYKHYTCHIYNKLRFISHFHNTTLNLRAASCSFPPPKDRFTTRVKGLVTCYLYHNNHYFSRNASNQAPKQTPCTNEMSTCCCKQPCSNLLLTLSMNTFSLRLTEVRTVMT